MKAIVMHCQVYRANSSCDSYCMGLNVSNIYDEVYVLGADHQEYCNTTEIDLAIPRQEILQIVADELGMHAEPYWSTPKSLLPPKGYQWEFGGNYVRVGKLKEGQENIPLCNLDLFLPVWDELTPIFEEAEPEDEFFF